MDNDEVAAAEDELHRQGIDLPEADQRKAHKSRGSAKFHARRIATLDMRKMLTIDDVLDLVPLGKSTIYRMMDEGRFPKSRKIGQRAIVWSRSEIEAWIDEKLS